MNHFEGLPLDLFHKLIKLICPWGEHTDWLSTRKHVNTVLPLRLLDRQWRYAVDICYYYWNFMRFTTPVLNQMEGPASKQRVIQYLLKQKMLKSITGK